MIDIDKQIRFWKNSAMEDWSVAQDLLQLKRTRHSLFFAHLALEKVLKGHVSGFTKAIPPKLHNLVRLAELAGLALTQEQVDILAEMNSYNLEGRYPDMLLPALTVKEATAQLKRAEKVYEWLLNQLPA